MSKEHCLIGKAITEIKLAKDRQAILFSTTAGDLVVLCHGDCCSETWVEGIELPALGFPAVVLAVEDVDMPERPCLHRVNTDVVTFYGCKITTDRGELLIDYRNESNGYYGGNLSWPTDNHFYGGVHGQNVSSQEFEALP